mgnify:CR=1 FL=1
MFLSYFLVFFCGIVAFIAMAAAFTAYEVGETDLGTGMSILFAVMVLLEASLWASWDDRLIDAASDFFKTREKVYKCENLSSEVCKYKKLIWQKDSTTWQTRLNDIINK